MLFVVQYLLIFETRSLVARGNRFVFILFTVKKQSPNSCFRPENDRCVTRDSLLPPTKQRLACRQLMSLWNMRSCRCEIHNNTSGVAFWVFYPVSRSFFTLTTMPPKHRAIRRPKRKFSGNQFTKPSKENAKRTKEAKEQAHGSNTLGQHTKKSVSSEKLLLKSNAMESKPGKVEFWVLSFKLIDWLIDYCFSESLESHVQKVFKHAENCTKYTFGFYRKVFTLKRKQGKLMFFRQDIWYT